MKRKIASAGPSKNFLSQIETPCVSSYMAYAILELVPTWLRVPIWSGTALILNNIFDSGDFPKEWALGIIVILFKDGTKSKVNNYKGITLLSMLGKLLVGVLNNRLWEVVDRFDILRENQAGFQHGYRTTDHSFTLTTIINRYAVKGKKKIIVLFC